MDNVFGTNEVPKVNDYKLKDLTFLEAEDPLISDHYTFPGPKENLIYTDYTSNFLNFFFFSNEGLFPPLSKKPQHNLQNKKRKKKKKKKEKSCYTFTKSNDSLQAFATLHHRQRPFTLDNVSTFVSQTMEWK